MIDAEKYVIGLLLQNPEIYPDVVAKVDADWFTDAPDKAPTKKVYNAILKLIEQRTKPDLVTLSAETRLSTSYLHQFVELPTHSENLESYLEQIRQSAYKQALSNVYTELVNDNSSPDDLQTKTEKAMAEVRKRFGAKSNKHHVASVIERYQERVALEVEIPLDQRVIRTPFNNLNYLIGGLYGGRVVGIGGRPGIGKTELITQLEEDALNKGFSVVSFILESGEEAILERQLSKRLNIPLQQIIERTFLEKLDAGKFYSEMAKMSDWNWTLYGSDYTYYPTLRRALQEHVDDNTRLITVDYIQLINNPDGENRAYQLKNAVQDIARIIVADKANPQDPKTAAVIGSQLSRTLDQRADKRPTLSDFKEGSIEEPLDVAIGIYRDDYYTKGDSETPGVVELDILKNRISGQFGTAKLYFNKEKKRLYDLMS